MLIKNKNFIEIFINLLETDNRKNKYNEPPYPYYAASPIINFMPAMFPLFSPLPHPECFTANPSYIIVLITNTSVHIPKR